MFLLYIELNLKFKIKKYILIEVDKDIIKEVSDMIYRSIKDTIDLFKKEFDSSIDLTIREFYIGKTKACIITMEGMVDKKNLSKSVISPIMESDLGDISPKEKYNYLRDHVISSVEQTEVQTYKDAFFLVMSGFALIIIDECDQILCIGVQGFAFRGVSEPNTELTQRGSRESFVEPLRINMSLIRRRIKNPCLKFESMKIGKISNTEVCLCYLTNIVSKNILDKVRKSIKDIEIDTVLAAGYLSPFLKEKKKLSLFSNIGISERPDTVCGKISEGRIVIIVDGTPNVLIVPYLFTEYFQTFDDYVVEPYFATFIRWLKYISFFLAMLLPGLYVAVGMFNQELLPTELLIRIVSSVSETPFSMLTETIIVHFMYEIMREAGLRLPRPLGHAISIIGALVIGDTAVSAGLIGAPTLMVVALTALSSYVVPNLYEPIAILRLIFILIGGTTGIWGIMLLLSAILINICSKSNFGVPFLSPISPFNFFDMRDTLIRASWKVLAKKTNKIQDMPGAHTERE